MAFELGHEFASKLARIVGIDPDETPVHSVTIKADHDACAAMMVVILLDDEQAREILSLVEGTHEELAVGIVNVKLTGDGDGG